MDYGVSQSLNRRMVVILSDKLDTVWAGFARLSLYRATATASPVNHYKVASGSVKVMHLRRV
jgi:hypothetical protein